MHYRKAVKPLDGTNKDVSGAKLQLMTTYVCPVDSICDITVIVKSCLKTNSVSLITEIAIKPAVLELTEIAIRH